LSSFFTREIIWLTFIEKKTKKIGNWKCPLIVQNKSKYFENFTLYRNAKNQWKLYVSTVICWRLMVGTHCRGGGELLQAHISPLTGGGKAKTIEFNRHRCGVWTYTPKTKIDFVKNRYCVKISGFLNSFFLFFLALLKITGNFNLPNAITIFTFPSNIKLLFPIKILLKKIEVLFDYLSCAQTQIKNKTHIIVKSIHLSLRSESKSNNFLSINHINI